MDHLLDAFLNTSAITILAAGLWLVTGRLQRRLMIRATPGDVATGWIVACERGDMGRKDKLASILAYGTYLTIWPALMATEWLVARMSVPRS